MKSRTRMVLIAWLIACATMMFTVSAHADLEDPQPYKGFPQLLPEINNYIGSAAQRIPIAVPPGRLGLQPNLAFTYNSYKKFGIMGFGWEIEPGHIQRRTQWGVHYDQDEFDIVFHGQKFELVPISDRPDYFRARIEGDFNQYHFVRSGDYWEVIQSDGTRYCFGHDPYLNQGRNARQSNDLGTFKWCLAHVRDTNGNYMTVDYLVDQGQVYPQYINYTGGEGSEPANLVEFTYESTDRPDPEISYASKSRVVTALRLESVKTHAYTNSPADTPALEYRLEYELSAEGRNSLLKKIRIIGSDGVKELPGYTFNYQAGDLGGYGDMIENESVPLGNNNDFDRSFADINGDNKDDLILVKKFSGNGNGGIIRVYPSNGDGTFGSPKISSLGYVQDDANYRTSVVNDILYQSDHFADINGDARTDLVQYHYKVIHGDERSWVKVNQIRTFIANDNGTFSPGQVLFLEGDNYSYSVSLNVVDLNNDGYADIYFQGRGATFQNDGHGYFTQVGTPPFPGNEVYTRYLVDINGDGLTDLVNYHYDRHNDAGAMLTMREFSIYLSDGQGDYVYANTQDFMELFPNEVLPDRKKGWLHSISFSDVNNDGRPDLVIKTKRDYSDPLSTQFWLSDGAGTFTFYEMRSGWGTIPADLNGDGVDDLIAIKHEEDELDNGTLVINYNYIRSWISQNVIPYNLMINATSPSGAEISYTYDFSSNQNQLFLPFLMYPVATVTVDDGVRGQPSVSTYTQELGYYDAAEKEYRGFELSSRANPDNTLTQTYHFVGLETHPDHTDYPHMPDDCTLDNYYLNGRVRQVDLFDAPGGNLLSRATYQWTLAEHPTDGWAFVKPALKRTEYYDDQSVFSQEDYVYDVDQDGLSADSAGLLKKITASGTGASDIVTEYGYVNYSGDAYAPIWRKTLEKVYDDGQSTAPSRHFEYVYDAGTGNLVQKIGKSSDPEIDDSTWTYDYYDNGLLHNAYDANAHPPTNFALYDETRTFPTSIIDPLGHETIKTWDTRWGLETTVTDPNLQTTAYTYDEFGRLKRTDLPDGGYTQLVFSDYCTDQACSNVGLPRQVQAKVRTVGSQTEDTLFYFDGLARKVQTSKTGEGGNFIIAKTHYDTLGRAEFTSGPFFQNSEAYLSWNDYTIDGYNFDPGDDYPYVFTQFDKRRKA